MKVKVYKVGNFVKLNLVLQKLLIIKDGDHFDIDKHFTKEFYDAVKKFIL